MRTISIVWLTILLVLVGCASKPGPVLQQPGTGLDSVEARELPSSPWSPPSGSGPAISSLDTVSNLALIYEIVSRGFTEWGCDEWRMRRASWSPPTEGSPVHRYIMRIEAVMDSIPDTTLVLPWPRFWDSGTCSIQAWVCGVDSLGRQGPWSLPSDIEIMEVE